MITFTFFKPETPRVRKLVFFSFAVMVCFCVIASLQAFNSYRQSVTEASKDASRLTRILSDHVELTFLSVDLSLRRAVERQYFNAMFGGNLSEYMEHNFAVWVRELPQISAMMLINEQGHVEAAAYERGFENFIISSRSVESNSVLEVGRQQSDEDSYFYFTPGYKKNDPQSEVIIMSRKLNKLDGSYGGVVLAAIDPKYFVDFFNSVSQGKNHFMSIILSSGTVMASSPAATDHTMLLRKIMTDAAKNLRKSEQPKTHTDKIDDISKIFSSHQLGSFPVVVSIALDGRDYLSQWKHNQFKDLLFMTIFLLFGTAVSLFAVTMEKQIKRVQRSEAAAVLASQTKSEFLANMSHEFRTPLNAIIGFSDMLLGGYFGTINSKQKERINDINLCGNHLLQLISDILEFSKGEAGKLELREELVEIEQIVEECQRMMREKINTKNIQLRMVLDKIHPWMLGDSRKVRQILLNLISNAVKFTPQQGTIVISSYLNTQGNMCLSVSDTGIGISETDVPKAMSVFGQVHRSQSLEGTGLGLPLCKIFAELHGGSLNISSTLGVGTTVEIVFPKYRILTEEESMRLRSLQASSSEDQQGILPLQKNGESQEG